MIISRNSQLGLRISDNTVKVNLLTIWKNTMTVRIDSINSKISLLENSNNLNQDIESFKIDFDKERDYSTIRQKVESCVKKVYGESFHPSSFIEKDSEDQRYFLICDSVYEAAELIKIGEGFTSRTLKDINIGHYTYLMGKHRAIKFVVVVGAIIGIYIDEESEVVLDFGLDIETGEYYVNGRQYDLFSMIMQILTFVELGDIEITEIAAGRNNGKTKKDGKITNTHNYTVYVVDSSWNKLIIRTDGFAVRGHFRLQPYGINMADRKLIWINSFEKHGYTRRPKAEIAH